MAEDFEPEIDPDLFDDHAFDEDDLASLDDPDFEDDEEYNNSDDDSEWEDQE